MIFSLVVTVVMIALATADVQCSLSLSLLPVNSSVPVPLLVDWNCASSYPSPSPAQVYSMFVAAFGAAFLLIFTGCVSPTQAWDSIRAGVLITISASFAIGKAMENSGVAEVRTASVLPFPLSQPLPLPLMSPLLYPTLTIYISLSLHLCLSA